jgi:hypothetical protein
VRRFLAGACYSTRSPCDHDCIISAEIIGRTRHTVRAVINGRGDAKTFRVREDDGAEHFNPWGRYSMAPVLTA